MPRSPLEWILPLFAFCSVLLALPSLLLLSTQMGHFFNFQLIMRAIAVKWRESVRGRPSRHCTPAAQQRSGTSPDSRPRQAQSADALRGPSRCVPSCPLTAPARLLPHPLCVLLCTVVLRPKGQREGVTDAQSASLLCVLPPPVCVLVPLSVCCVVSCGVTPLSLRGPSTVPSACPTVLCCARDSVSCPSPHLSACSTRGSARRIPHVPHSATRTQRHRSESHSACRSRATQQARRP